MSIEQFDRINRSVDAALDEADVQASTTSLRYTHEEVFDSIRKGLNAKRA